MGKIKLGQCYTNSYLNNEQVICRLNPPKMYRKHCNAIKSGTFCLSDQWKIDENILFLNFGDINGT